MSNPRKGTLKVLKVTRRPEPALVKRTYEPSRQDRFNVVKTVTHECTLIEDQQWRTMKQKENACRENNITMLSELISQGLIEGEALERAKKTIQSLRLALRESDNTLKAVR